MVFSRTAFAALVVASCDGFKQLGNLKMPSLGNIAKDMEARSKFGASPAPPPAVRVVVVRDEAVTP